MGQEQSAEPRANAQRRFTSLGLVPENRPARIPSHFFGNESNDKKKKFIYNPKNVFFKNILYAQLAIIWERKERK